MCGIVEKKRLAFVSTHTPHEFEKVEAKHVFWDTLAITIVKIMKDYDRNVWLLLEAIAHTGSELSSASASVQPECQNSNDALFHPFLLPHSICALNTSKVLDGLGSRIGGRTRAQIRIVGP